ncbi:MAG TPA: mechanosensitive ion channel domain-containing protein [Longimicrobiales bacterium]|nr:mechanosensitive ion channel domain-containing protein [Longimicrobiales bacterium]
MDLAEFARLADRVIKYPLFTIQGQAITPMDLITFAVFVVATLFVSHVLRRSALKALARRGVDDQGTRTITRRLIHYVVLVIGLGTAVSNLGFNLSTIFAAGAVLGVGLGFAFQNVAQNFLSGLLLLFERSITPGDVLWVEGRVVRVEDLRIRSTVARTRGDEQLIIPNSTLAQNTVINYTMNDPLFRVRVDVGVTYDSDMRLVRETLERVAGELPGRVASREPVVLMTAFGSSSVDFEVSVWTDDPWGSRRATSDLHEAVWWGLKEAGIVIAFPQLDVHLRPDVEDAVSRLPKAS